MSPSTPLSILDLAIVRHGQTVRSALDDVVTLAQRAEQRGYSRVWYAEHHNMSSIASSATSVMIAHVAANTSTIRLGSGGVMLPNHSPLTIAEQFGTLEELHPGRIDLGLGRAPGTDQNTFRALRRDLNSSDRFPQDVLELQAFLGSSSRIPGVTATPGANTNVPLYILGSSLFGAQLAAQLGLPYAFASHFAPGSLEKAIETYRREFTPSEQLGEPYVIAAVNVIAADSVEDAEEQRRQVTRSRVARFLGGAQKLTEQDIDQIIASPQGRQVLEMLKYFAVGDAPTVRAYLDDFTTRADADELIIAHASPTIEQRLRSVDLLAEVSDFQ